MENSCFVIINHFYIRLKAQKTEPFLRYLRSSESSSELLIWFFTSVTFGLFFSTYIETIARNV